MYDFPPPKRYISVDIEASGPTPGRYSMLSLGACVVGDRSKTFYRELKPISDELVTSAMRVGCLGLECIASDMRADPRYDPESEHFEPNLVLERLGRCGSQPGNVMGKFAFWIDDVARGYRPIFAAAPAAFDGMWVHWYFDNFFDGKNPFGFSGEDISSLYRGMRGDENASIVDIAEVKREGMPHNALDDALYQARLMEFVLHRMKDRR
jgi:hypothetical protein